jgi:hypothetical protein
MEIPIQTRIDAVAAAVDRVLSDDELTPRLQLLVLEALAREIAVRIDRMSEQQGGEQAL